MKTLKILSILITGILAAVSIMCGCGGSQPAEVQSTILETEAVTSESINTELQSVEEKATSEEMTEAASVAIELVAGEAGEYGKEVVMSEGTDFEERFIVYYVPAGTYIVKNLGEYRTQVTVYEGFTKDDETGYDDYTNVGDIVLLDVGGTDEIEVPEGWFIEILEPTHIALIAK